MTIRVLLADDQALVRSAFALLIRSAPDMTVVGEADEGDQAHELVRGAHPDVVVMDIRMPGVDGIEATDRIARDEDLAGVRVLILTTFESDENVLAAIRTVAAGDALLSPGATRSLITRVLRTPDPAVASAASLQELTGREREVLTLIGRGLNNAELAEALVISPLTAKTYVSRLLTKLDARDRAQLVIAAYESGLVQTG
ncbi:response regulator [Amycolatopsis cihanbeyliensis]|uniref:DNA-binding NarL/FixJ family response regulator n=1 Tax=Amycolatopsis cihanbeyliensis TaxID=1128664 RepID=A0A542CTK2_AMYCI|nr:response regulator transcription factor [Amycolatopsis cihanbeyliensis]TQI94155.1 DNA-binding NarL/FixJ family response regulator [Amycolatopsis cihanbeyliensis]